jgi:hypothetical protein
MMRGEDMPRPDFFYLNFALQKPNPDFPDGWKNQIDGSSSSVRFTCSEA